MQVGGVLGEGGRYNWCGFVSGSQSPGHKLEPPLGDQSCLVALN